MANLPKGVRTYLLTNSDLTDLVAQRVYVDVIPQGGTVPCVVAVEMDDRGIGGVTAATGLAQCVLRLKCYHTDPDSAVAIRDQVRSTLLDRPRGTMGDVTIRGLAVHKRGTGVDPPLAGSDQWRWHKWIDFLITYNE